MTLIVKMMIKLIILSAFLLSLRICNADTNLSSGRECSEAENSTSENSFKMNLDSLLNTLAANGPVRNGFYRNSVGKDSYKVYGLIQCRGDVSAADCANCTQESIEVASQDCQRSKQVKVWFKWCFIRYSNENFFGVWGESSFAIYNDTDFDDPSVVPKGLNFMTELATTAPEEPLMFQTAELDVGESGKRYGMAQCTRDLSRTDCANCLDALLVSFRTGIGNKRGWEIYGSSCSMWFHDFQFYFDISTPANHGPRRSSPEGVAIDRTMAVLMLSVALW